MEQIENLFEKLHKDLMVGLTYFKEPNKKWMCCSYYETGNNNISVVDGKVFNAVFGSTLQEVLEKAIKQQKQLKIKI